MDEGSQLATDLPIKDKAKYIVDRLREIAQSKDIELKLRKKGNEIVIRLNIFED